MNSESGVKRRVFVSYSRKDKKWLDRLRPYLEGGSDDVKYWDDTEIPIGADWRQKLDSALHTADAAILLVSQNYLASSFIRQNELPPLLLAAKQRGCAIFPIIVEPCRFAETTSISQFQAANDPKKPLTALGAKYREVFLDLVRQIETLSTSDFVARQAALREGIADVYLGVPMNSARDSYDEMRELAAEVASAFAECGCNKVYCAALEVESPTVFDTQRVTLQTFRRLMDNARMYVMIYPAEVPSSVLVEAGYAYNLGIHSVYMVRQGVKLPFMLEAFNKSDNVDVLPYTDGEDIGAKIVSQYKSFFGR